MAGSLNNLASRLAEVGRISEALAPAEEAVTLYRRLAAENPAYASSMAGSLNNLASRLAEVGRISEALAPAEEAVTLYRRLAAENPAYTPGLATSLNSLGARYRALGRADDAILRIQEALSLLQQLASENPAFVPILTDTLSNSASTLSDLARFDEAIRSYNQALVTLQNFEDRPAQARILANLGLIYKLSKHYDESVSSFEHALSLSQEIKDRQSQGWILNNMGSAYADQERYDEAIDAYRSGLAIAQEVGNVSMEALSLLNLADASAQLHRYTEAIETYQHTLATLRRIGDDYAEATVLNKLGAVYSGQRRFTEAIEVYKQALALLRNLGDRQAQGQTLVNLGRAYASTAKRADALVAYEESLIIARELGDEQQAALRQKLLTYVLTYVTYSDDLERPRPDEDELVNKIVKVLHQNNEWAFRKYKHAIRDAHAKSHGILRGELTVYRDLPDYLRQGLFATPATYPVIARLSSTSGAIRSDQIRGVRGLGIKVLGVHGPRALPDDHATTQDFLLVTHREFPFADVHAYYVRGMPMARLLARLPDTALGFASELLGGAVRLLPLVGLSGPSALALFIQPNTHILGDTFYSSAPLRYGDYVAKICVAPLSDSVTALLGERVPRGAGPDAFRDMVVEFFHSSSAEYELRAQLCTDLAVMPIEDASVTWPESASPHCGVAKITFPVQDASSPERQVFGDDVLSFNPWRGLADHRPLGSINRLKKQVYEASSQFRHKMNNVARIEPTDIAELPE
jgi:tetratricopeptide (TPR) repeat protein